MNEHIARLAREAGFCGGTLSNTQPGTCIETALENFAKLIVQDCADAADAFPVSSIYVGDYLMEHMGYCPADDRHS